MSTAHGAEITSLASARGLIYSASEDGTVGIWPMSSLQPGRGRYFAVSADGTG